MCFGSVSVVSSDCVGKVVKNDDLIGELATAVNL